MWSFGTYVRPFVHGAASFRADGTHDCVENILWAAIAGTGLPNASDTSGAAVEVTTGSQYGSLCKFDQSDVHELMKLNLYFALENTTYRLNDCQVNQVEIDFAIDGIATLSWSGNCTSIDQVTSAIEDPSKAVHAKPSGTDAVSTDPTRCEKFSYVDTTSTSDADYLRNKLSQLTLAVTEQGGGSAGGQSAHEPSVTYQWERSDDGGNSFSPVGGATSAAYTTSATTYAVDHNDQYRCVISAVGAAADATTNAVTLTVQRTYSITAQPSNVTANEGGTATFAITTSTSSGAPTYQWERSDDNGANYASVGGATSASYTTPSLVYADDGNDRYRCVASLVGAAADITSNFAVLTVLRVITIQTHPQSQAVIEGGTATFNIGAQITSDVISYQWEKSTDNGLNFNAISGANSSTYTTPTTSYPTTPSEQFRCVLSNVAATTVTSTSATLTVNESEFVSAPTSVTPFIDTDTSKTLSRQPVITTAAYVSEYAGSTHFSTFWRIRRVADNVTVYDTTGTFVNGDTGNLTSFTVPSGVLDFDITYSVQVKFRDNNGLESAYTSAVNFSTPLVDQPDIQTITPAFNPTINVDPIQLKSGYQHSSSDWQFSPANTFATIVHQSLGNSTNLTQYTLPGAVNLSANTTYYVRIRFNVNPT